MKSSPVIPKLAAGAFYGETHRSVTTPSFDFSSLQAVVPERQVPRHTHETPHFILVTSGVYFTEARNQSGVCLPGTLIFNPAGTTHRDCFRSTRGTFVSISPGVAASRLLDRASPLPVVVSETGVHSTDHRLIANRIASEFEREPDLSAFQMEALGMELIGVLACMEDRNSAGKAPPWLIRAKEMIEGCAEHNLSVESVAVAVGVHPVYLARAYRRYFRCSPGEHQRRCRVLRARSLLTTTGLPLVEVALRCGFSDQSQMTRSFCEIFGVPPARYIRWLGKTTGTA